VTAVQSWLPANVAGLPDGTEVQVSGTLTNVVVGETAQGRRWAVAAVVTGDGSVRVRVYPKVYAACRGLLVGGGRVTVTGLMDRRDTVPFVLARGVRS
jgi:DNA polymerase III subunit alpha